MIKIGRVQVSIERRQLLSDGKVLAIGTRAFDILELLIAAEGKVVRRDEIFRTVWPNAVVEQSNLQVHISALRKAFGNDRNLIETVPGRGYRLLEPGAPLAEPPGAPHEALIEAQRAAVLTPARVPILIGRDADVAATLAALQANRVVTLVGPGGIGKTQLALAAAHRAAAARGTIVCFVPLSPLTDGRFVAETVAGSLGIRLSAGVSLESKLAEALSACDLVILLDNCEHVLDEAARACGQLVASCPHACIIATSRTPLGIGAERVIVVPPLELPVPRDDVANLAVNPAVQLFVAKSGAFAEAYGCQPALESIGAICRRLDGIPLAIEIASAQAASIGVAGVLAALDDFPRFVESGFRSAESRRRTLKATFDWSYRLLGDREKAVFRRLAPFPDDFSLEGAQSAVKLDDLSDEDVALALSRLVAKSILTVRATDHGPRYVLMQVTRFHAGQKLAEAGETRAAYAAHACYVLSLFRSDDRRAHRTAPPQLAKTLRLELVNVRAALDWCMSDVSGLPVGLALASTVLPHFYELSLASECCQRAEQMLAWMDRAGVDQPVARMTLASAYAASRAYTKGPISTTRALWSEVLALAGRTGNPDFKARALWGLWHVSQIAGRAADALDLAQQFATIADQQQGDTQHWLAQRVLGVALHFHGDQREARKCLLGMLSSYDYDRHQWPPLCSRLDYSVAARATLARVMWLQGDVHTAREMARGAVDDAEAQRSEMLVCHVLAEAVLPLDLYTNDIGQAKTDVRRLRELTSRYEFTVWDACARCYELSIALFEAPGLEALARLRTAVVSMEAIGFGRYSSLFESYLIAALHRKGLSDDALDIVGAAIERRSGLGDRVYLADLWRLKSDILRDTGRLAGAAECADIALTLARTQGAWLLEIRATLSVAKLRQIEGQATSAAHLAESVIARCGADRDIVELGEARALLSKLRHADAYLRTRASHRVAGARRTSASAREADPVEPGAARADHRTGSDEVPGDVFSLASTPVLSAETAGGVRMSATRVDCAQYGYGFTGAFVPEDAFLLGLQCRPMQPHELAIDGCAVPTHRIVPGSTGVYDLARAPVEYVVEPFHDVLFYLPRAALKEQGEELGVPSATELCCKPGTFVEDQVIFRLGLSLLPAFTFRQATNQLFVDHVMLALRSHMVLSYGGVRATRTLLRGALSPKQESEAKEIIESRVTEGLSLAEVANSCGMLPTEFVRAFRRSTGMTPHSWLVQRRLHRALSLIRDGMTCVEQIAKMAGFPDAQSFARTCVKKTGATPQVWLSNLATRL
jgi:predicted ATPase/DNA-binding winged helix-turn-helix (wHTH) protein/AraC-like DNA-binding protein/tetratricopeptide (TPR) repeat protein